ncbi:MAG: hypothetical protein K0R57_597 [Paenibacillaceae bacterium]|nr:hypothetical protein [Paenibacillaceae bacterium]
MHFSWNEATIAWFKAASDYTGFHRKLADRLRPVVAGSKSMYDMGCGLALLSQELAGSVDRIVCVDMNEAALADLSGELARKGINNMKPLLQDCYADGPECDVILLSYFGSSTLDRFLPRCRKLIAIVDRDERSSLAGQVLTGVDRKRQTANRVEEQLQEKGIRYTLEEVSLEFGQPFCSREDAVLFLKQYYRCTSSEAEEFTERRIQPAVSAPFTLYLPYMKNMGVFVVEGMCG